MDSRCAIIGTGKSTSPDKGSPNADRRLIVKYTKEERLDIGRRIYTGELSRYEASEKYGININTANLSFVVDESGECINSRKSFFRSQAISRRVDRPRMILSCSC